MRQSKYQSHIITGRLTLSVLHRNFGFSDVNVVGARRIAEISASMGVPRLVHISHLNASSDSPSAFYKTKAAGEQAVRRAFPNATIVRPGPMYGHEDRLLRSMAVWPSTWKLNQERTKLRPVHVMDVAAALANLCSMPPVPQTLSLPGPQVYTVEYLMELVSSVTYNTPSKALYFPKRLAKFISQVSSFVWWPVVGPDQVERRYINDVEVAGDWDVVGIKPDDIDHHALTYLQMYRSADNFNRPTVIPDRSLSGDPLGSYRVIQ